MRAVKGTSSAVRQAPGAVAAAPVDERPRRTWAARFAAPALIMAASLAAYHNSLRGPFIFDDEISIVYNPSVTQPATWWAVLRPATGGRTTQGRPILNATFALNYGLNHKDPWGYHAVNLLIHVACGLTLFGLLRRALCLPSVGARASATGLAAATAVLWVVHPLQTAAVTYISQRAESLAALFSLLTLYGFVRSLEPVRSRLWRTASVACCALGMATKETVAAAPVLVALFDLCFVGPSPGEVWRRRRVFYLGLAATYGVLAYLVVGGAARGGSAGLGLGVSSADYARTQCVAVVRYLRLALWPDDLVLDYGTRVVTRPAEYLPHACVVGVLLLATVAGMLRAPKAAFPAAAFFVLLLPSSSVVPVVTQTIGEHRMYLPLAGLLALAVVGGHAAWSRLLAQPGPPRAAPVLLVTAVALSLGTATIRRNETYRSAAAIWEDTTRKRPDNPRAWSSLGQAYYKAGRVQESVEPYTKSIALNADYSEAYLNRAVSFEALGRSEEAMRDFDRAIALSPDVAMAHQLRGNALFGRRQFESAIAEYTRFIELAPDLAATGFYNRGSGYQALGRFDAAVADFTRAITLRPGYCEAYNNRAVIYAVHMQRDDLAWADVEACRHAGGSIQPDFLQFLEARRTQPNRAGPDGG